MLSFYTKIKSYWWMQIFTILTRYLIGGAFALASIPKILGNRFTNIGTESEIGAFFEALYQSGMYWNFLGWSQTVAAFFLMTQLFSTFGAILFFPIIVNIFVITVALQFPGTIIITCLMLLANTFLLIWDYDKLKYIFYQNAAPSVDTTIRKTRLEEHKIWVIIGFILFLLPSFCYYNNIHMLTWFAVSTIITVAGLIGYWIIEKRNLNVVL